MDEKTDPLTRREFLWRSAAAGAVCSTPLACDLSANEKGGVPKHKEQEMSVAKPKPTSKKLPTIFLPHGGGPWPFTHDPVIGNPKMYAQMSQYMKNLHMVPPVKPKAILIISAHWEEGVFTVQSGEKPPMLYDYYGFAPETYEVQWPAPGAPEIAGEIQSLLQNAGFQTGLDPARGFDHGVFVPLKLAYPKAEVPSLQLSLKKGLDPKIHFQMGRALAPLREQGVLIVGSGMSYHNMQAFMQNMRRGPYEAVVIDDSKAFDEWLGESVLHESSQRETRLVEWEKAPKARAAHPREEHLLPLHVVAGAAGNDTATLPYRDVVMGAHISAVHFG